MHYEITSTTQRGSRDQDRVACFNCERGWIFALADGAGGTCAGAEAAELVLQSAQQGRGLVAPAEILLQVDERLVELGAQTTGIVIYAFNNVLIGASCDDSQAWLCQSELVIELTKYSARKPLLGSGGLPVSFGPIPFVGTLLIASDGLFSYTTARAIQATCQSQNLPQCQDQLLNLVRLPNGELQDDIAILLARRKLAY